MLSITIISILLCSVNHIESTETKEVLKESYTLIKKQLELNKQIIQGEKNITIHGK